MWPEGRVRTQQGSGGMQAPAPTFGENPPARGNPLDDVHAHNRTGPHGGATTKLSLACSEMRKVVREASAAMAAAGKQTAFQGELLQKEIKRKR